MGSFHAAHVDHIFRYSQCLFTNNIGSQPPGIHADQSQALYGIFPPARTIRKLRQNNDDKTWAFEQVTDGPTSGFRWSNPKVNKVAGFLCATLLFISAYFDGKELFPLAWAAQVVWALVGWHAPRIRMKAIVMIQLGVVVSCV